MAGTLYALLVGIDDYEGDVPPLGGCVNDIDAVEPLIPTLVADSTAVKSLVLVNDEATRKWRDKRFP